MLQLLGVTEMVASGIEFLMTISSVELQVPLVIVQRSVISVLLGTEVMVVVADEADVIVANPLTRLQAPVPEEGLLPAMVNVEVLHKV